MEKMWCIIDVEGSGDRRIYGWKCRDENKLKAKMRCAAFYGLETTRQKW